MSDARLNEHEQRIVDNVLRHGCHITYVFDPDGEKPDFAYSVGFEHSLNQPEVIVFGLNRELMHSMINEIFRQCRAGLRLSDGLTVDGLLEGHTCIAREVAAENIVPEHLNSAIWYARTQLSKSAPRAYQLVWPGAQNRLFPWDDGSSPEVRDLQPPLYERRLAS